MNQKQRIADFHTLHQSGCFLLPNPWDVGTAIYLQHLGFQALATTSAGFAFSRGQPDGSVSRDGMLAHITEITHAVSVPVNADFLAGFADDPEPLADNVERCLQTGVAGLSIEDSIGNARLYPEALAVARIRAARTAIDASGIAALLTARCEAWLVDDPAPLSQALRRLVAFAEAGADCLYAPGVRDPREISELVAAVAPKPLNVLISRPGEGLSLRNLADLGVRRISVGSALACAAWGAFMRSAREMREIGTFAGLAEAAAFSELNDLFQPASALPVEREDRVAK